MRIVLDTNVLISGIFFQGPSYRILQAWKEKKVQFVISPEIYDEYTRVAEVLSKKHNHKTWLDFTFFKQLQPRKQRSTFV